MPWVIGRALGTCPLLLLQLGRLLLGVCSVVPGGVVAFAPSFAYAAQLVARWTASGMLSKIAAK